MRVLDWHSKPELVSIKWEFADTQAALCFWRAASVRGGSRVASKLAEWPTPRSLSRMAAQLYPEGPVLFRALQQYRPFICPFEELIVEVPKGAKILDIGCGGGLLLGLLGAAGLRPDGTGFDVSRPAIALAQRMAAGSELAGARLDFRRLDADAPWPEGDFDVVSMIDVIHHVQPSEQEAAIRRACGKVRPGGLSSIRTWLKGRFGERRRTACTTSCLPGSGSTMCRYAMSSVGQRTRGWSQSGRN